LNNIDIFLLQAQDVGSGAPSPIGTRRSRERQD